MAASTLQRYAELGARVNAFFARVHGAHRDAMQCGRGCDACCRQRLSVTSIEAASIAAGLATLSEAERREIAEHAAAASADRCAALDDDGACRIYPWRPLVCRSHGVPIRAREPDGAVTLSVCRLNFDGGAGLDSVPDADVLDQTTVSTILGALDAAFSDARGIARGTRVDLAELLASCVE